MFLDINGNTFSTLGNTNKVPTLTYNPLQLFGSDLKLWVDFTDKSTLFTDTACTTNVTVYGDFIRGIIDKSLNSKKLQKVGTTVTGSTDYQWSSNTFNTLGGCLRTAPQIAGTTDVGFHHEDATFLTSNTNYSVHFVARLQSTTNTPALYSYGFNSNIILISPTNALVYSNPTQVTIQNITNITNLLYCSIQFYFDTEQFESIRNNSFIPIVSSSTAISYNSGKLRLFSRYGSSPPTNVSPVQNFYCHEIYFVQGVLTTEQLNLTHQYLRLKYS